MLRCGRGYLLNTTAAIGCIDNGRRSPPAKRRSLPSQRRSR